MAVMFGWCTAGLVYIEGCSPRLPDLEGASTHETLSMGPNAATVGLNSPSKIERGEGTSASIENEADTSKEVENRNGKSHYWNGMDRGLG